MASELDMLQAKVRWQNQIPKVTEAKKNYELMLANLKDFAGIDSVRDLELSGDLETYPPKPPTLQLNSIFSKRPDFRALVWEKALRETNVSSQKAGYYPSLEGSAIYAFSALSDEWKLDNRNNNIILGVTLSIPIYTAGFTGAEVQKAKIDVQKTNIKIEKTREKIANDLHNIYLRLDEAEQRITSAKSALQTAEKAFKISQTSADQGIITQLDLKQTRLFLDQAKLNYYLAVFDYLSAYFDWQQATGTVQ